MRRRRKVSRKKRGWGHSLSVLKEWAYVLGRIVFFAWVELLTMVVLLASAGWVLSRALGLESWWLGVVIFLLIVVLLMFAVLVVVGCFWKTNETFNERIDSE